MFRRLTKERRRPLDEDHWRQEEEGRLHPIVEGNDDSSLLKEEWCIPTVRKDELQYERKDWRHREHAVPPRDKKYDYFSHADGNRPTSRNEGYGPGCHSYGSWAGAEHAGLDPFVYTPMRTDTDTLRLLRAQPMNGPARAWEMREFAFRDRPRYDALSYCWGPASDPTSTINIEHRKFVVRRNLWTALRFFENRWEDFSGYLWVDAICINQDDVAERNREVRRMGQIYERAEKVVVWLGEDSMSLPRGQFSGISRNPYWERLWIIQEVVNAWEVVVVLDSDTVLWNQLADRTYWSNGRNTTPSDTFLRRLATHRRHRHREELTLDKLVKMHAKAQCQDPRDKIYGLIGLSTDGSRFPVGYDRTIFQVWRDGVDFFGKTGHASVVSLEAARFMATLLEVTKTMALPDALKDHWRPENSRPSGLRVELPGTFLGNISHLGPRPDEMLESLDLWEQWSTTVRGLPSLGSGSYESIQALRDRFNRFLRNHESLPDFGIFTLAENRAGGVGYQRKTMGNLPALNFEVQGPQAARLAILQSKKNWDICLVPTPAPQGSALYWLPEFRRPVVISSVGLEAKPGVVGPAWLAEQFLADGSLSWYIPAQSPKIQIDTDAFVLLLYSQSFESPHNTTKLNDAREKDPREKAAREKDAREKAAREKAAREKEAKERDARVKEARKKEAREIWLHVRRVRGKRVLDRE